MTESESGEVDVRSEEVVVEPLENSHRNVAGHVLIG